MVLPNSYQFRRSTAAPGHQVVMTDIIREERIATVIIGFGRTPPLQLVVVHILSVSELGSQKHVTQVVTLHTEPWVN
jgi:hypothetical protein